MGDAISISSREYTEVYELGERGHMLWNFS